MFPHEAVPDGAVFVAHHYNYLSAAAMIVLLTVWDDYRDREPLIPFGAVATGLFAFLFMWPVRGYHSLGAMLALAGPVVASLGVLRPWGPWFNPESEGGYPTRVGVMVVLLSLGALDDAVEHAFPVGSPLDYLFGVLGVEGSFVALLVASALGAVALTGWDRLRRLVGVGPTGEPS